MQVGPGVREQKVRPAYAAPQGPCENILCVLTMVTLVTEGNQLGAVLQEATEVTYQEADGGGTARAHQR